MNGSLRIQRIRRILLSLEVVSPEAALLRLKQEALDQGGHFKPARPGDEWDSQRIEITLHGIYSAAEDAERLVADWIDRARDEIERDTQLTVACGILREGPDQVAPDVLRAACETILAFDTGGMIAMARRMLASLDGKAA